MGKKLLRNINGFNEFKSKYTFFDCEKEYPGWTGKERYAIFADCALEQIETEYPEIIEAMKPVLLLPLSAKSARDEYRANENKYAYRNSQQYCIHEQNEETEKTFPELSVPDFVTELLALLDENSCRNNSVQLCRAALSGLTTRQMENLIYYYVNGKTFAQIAEERQCSKQAIAASVSYAKEKFIKVYKKLQSTGIPEDMNYSNVALIINRIVGLENEDESNDGK